MYERDWQRFLKEGVGGEIAIAQVSAAIVQHLGAASEKVYLHHSYAMKAAEKHLIGPADFTIIFDTVERGLALNDRPLHVTFFHVDADSGKWYQVTIKRAGESKRLYLSTFHRVKEREVRRRRKKHPEIGK